MRWTCYLPRFDCIEWLGGIAVVASTCHLTNGERVIHCDQACQSTNPKGAGCSELLAGSYITLSKLLDHGITPKSCGGVGSLPSCCWDESLKKPSYSTFSKYDTRPMQEASHAWIGRLAIVNSAIEL